MFKFGSGWIWIQSYGWRGEGVNIYYENPKYPLNYLRKTIFLHIYEMIYIKIVMFYN